jgi:hypothetical protein
LQGDVWERPGPHGFVVDIRTRLERGDQLTVVLPAGADLQALQAHVRRATPSLAFSLLPVIEAGELSPGEAIASVLYIDVPAGIVADEELLVAAPETAGLVLWIIGLGENERATSRWMEFISRYSRAVRRRGSDAAAMRMSACCAGDGFELLCRDEPGWSTAWYWGRVGRLDVGSYLQELEPLLDPVTRSEIVELAGFDFALADALLESGVADGDELIRVVQAFALESDVRRLDGGTPTTWCNAESPGGLKAAWAAGVVDRFDGEERAFWHSALFSSPESEQVLRRRLWSGQVRSLLPLLEEWRVLLFEHAQLEGFVAPDAQIDSVEFGPLHEMLRAGRQTVRRRALRDFAGWLRHSRNVIAHLGVISRDRRKEGERLAANALRR